MTDSAWVVLFRNNLKKDVFLVFRTDYPIWVLSGGGIEKGEQPKEAAGRETSEETGFKTKIVREVGTYFTKSLNNQRKIYLFEGRYVSGKYRPEFLGNIGKWFPVNKLPLRITKMTKERISDCLKKQNIPFLKESSTDWVISNIHLLLLQPIATIKYMHKNSIRLFKQKPQS